MFQENEIVMLFLCIGVLIFIYPNWKNLAKFKCWGLLFASFILMTVACASTIAEVFFDGVFLNYFEHSCYGGSGITLAIWSYKIFFCKSEPV